MDRLHEYSESFKLKFEKFLMGCDALEELGAWDKEQHGEMDAFFAADMVSVVLCLTVADGKVTAQEVGYINDIFGFDYTVAEVESIYEGCAEGIDSIFDEQAENAYSHLCRSNARLAQAYKELVCLACDIVIASDGVVSRQETELAERLKAWGARDAVH